MKKKSTNFGTESWLEPDSVPLTETKSGTKQNRFQAEIGFETGTVIQI